MRVLRFSMHVEALLLVACGLVCLAFPDTIGTVVNQPAPADTGTRRALGIVLLALAIPLFQMSMDVAGFNHLMLSYCLLPAGCLLALAIVYVQNGGLNGPAYFWGPAVAVLAALTVALWLSRATIARANPPPPLAPTAQVNDQTLNIYEAKMTYAWNWFQYHADQRLKAFNFFVVILGILVAAYGAAMKEFVTASNHPEAYEWFAIGVAVCGALISIAFLFIDVRNRELVDCGRRWLDSLEHGIGMEIRQDDQARSCLPLAVGAFTGGITPPSKLITHTWWIRTIYGMAALGFVAAFFYALWGFK